MITLEAYLIDSAHRGGADHRLRMTRGPDGEVRIALHPESIHGSALDLEVRGDTVRSLDLGIVSAPATKADVAAEVDRIAPFLDPHRHAGR